MSHLPDFKSEYSETYKKINVAGVFGGLLAGGLEAIIYSEERRAEKALESQPISTNKIYIKRTVEVELIIDPTEMKAIHQWLGDKIKEYEEIFGVIPSPEELESKFKRDPLQ